MTFAETDSVVTEAPRALPRPAMPTVRAAGKCGGGPGVLWGAVQLDVGVCSPYRVVLDDMSVQI